MTIYNWNGHTIEVESYASPKHLWLSLGFSVRVDSNTLFHSPDHMEGFGTVVPFELADAGNLRRGRVESGRPVSVLYARYRVFIDDQEVAKGSVRAGNWYVTIGVIFAFLALIHVLFR